MFYIILYEFYIILIFYIFYFYYKVKTNIFATLQLWKMLQIIWEQTDAISRENYS